MKPVTIGAAIKRAYAGRSTQVKIAEALQVGQGTVSRWANDIDQPSFDAVAAIEDLCGRPRGFVLRAAGYVVEATDVETLLATDPQIDDSGRDAVLALYRHYVATRPEDQ